MQRPFYILLFSIGLMLAVLTGYGSFSGVARHPLAQNLKTDVPRQSTAEAIGHRLDALSPADPTFPREITNTISDGINHYWVAFGKRDPNTQYGWTENWILAALIALENTAGKLLGTPIEKFSRLERYNLADILKKGVGLCSQASIALQAALADKDIPSRIVVLDGHVVVQTRHNDQSWLLDADYNVAMPLSLSEVQSQPSLIRPYYSAAGSARELTEQLVEIYGPAGNEVGYSPLTRVLIIAASWLKYMIPVALMAVAWWGARRKRLGAA